MLSLAGPAALGTSGTIVFAGGVLQASAANTDDYSARFSSAPNQAYAVDTGGQSVTLAAPLSSAGGTLTKLGAGTLVLAGSNSFTGLTTVSAGTLAIGAGGATGSLGGNVAVAGGAMLVFDRANDVAYGGSISGAGSLTKQAAGTLTLAAATSFTGPTRVASGTLALGHASALAGSTLDLAGGDAGTVAFTVPGTGTYALGGLQGSRDFGIGGNTVSIGAGGASTTYSGGLSGVGGLRKVGGGTLTLTGNNSYRGQTVVAGGQLVLAGGLAATGGSPSIAVAPSAGSTAVFTVSSGTLAAGGSGGLVVGDAGSGEFNQTGGSVTLGTGGLWIGKSTGGSGGATISGGTFVSVVVPTRVGNGALVVSGSADVTLAQLQLGNSVIGTTSQVFLRGGRLAVSNVTPAGPRPMFFFDGGTLAARSNDGALLVSMFTATILSGGAVIDTSGFAVGVPQSLDGGGGLTKTGSGTLTLSGNNSYGGGTMISAGTLSLGSAGAIGSRGPISFGGGVLQFTADNATDYSARFSTAPNQAFAVDTGGQSVTLAAPLSSVGGSLTKLGLGTLTLSGSNSYDGGTTISGGTLVATTPAAMPGSGTPGRVVFGGGTLQVAMGATAWAATQVDSLVNNATTTSGGLALDVAEGSQTLAGAVSGGLSLTKLGAGTLALAGSNSYTGTTTISAGTLIAATPAALPGNATAGRVVFAGGMLQIAVGGTAWTGSQVDSLVVNAVKTNGGLALDVASGSQSLTGAISGGIGLTKFGLGTLALSGSNTYTGTTTISAGTLVATTPAALPGQATAGRIVFDGGTLQLAVGGSAWAGSQVDSLIANAVKTSGDLALDVASGSQTLAGAISGGIGLTKLGAGTLTLTGTNTFGGTTRVVSGTLALGSSQALAGSTLDLAAGDAGTVAFAIPGSNFYQIAGLQGSRNLAFGANTLSINGSGSTTYSGQLSGSGDLIKEGPGWLTLTGSNSFTGLTDIGQGTLSIGNGGTSGSIAGDVSNSGTLVFNRSDNVTFGRSINGPGVVVKAGAGTLTITGNNVYQGGTVVSAGTLQVSGSGVAGGSADAPRHGHGVDRLGWPGNLLAERGGLPHDHQSLRTLRRHTLHRRRLQHVFRPDHAGLGLEHGRGAVCGHDHALRRPGRKRQRAVHAGRRAWGHDGSDLRALRHGVEHRHGPGERFIGKQCDKLRLANVNALQGATLDLAAGDVGVVEFAVDRHQHLRPRRPARQPQPRDRSQHALDRWRRSLDDLRRRDLGLGRPHKDGHRHADAHGQQFLLGEHDRGRRHAARGRRRVGNWVGRRSAHLRRPHERPDGHLHGGVWHGRPRGGLGVDRRRSGHRHVQPERAAR